jgi:acyl carrier protein
MILQCAHTVSHCSNQTTYVCSAHLLTIQVSPDEPLMAAGLDSLGSVELRNTLEVTLALALPPTLVRQEGTSTIVLFVAIQAAHCLFRCSVALVFHECMAIG